jgi:predicted transposase YbfD/YdcC
MPEKSSVLVQRLQTIPDPRRQGQNLKHLLPDILVLGFCGVVAGCDDFVEIAAWSRLHQDFFRTFLHLPNGIPSHDTFTRVFALVDASALHGILLGWLHQRRGLPGELIHLDGKTLRHTGRDKQNLGALQVVSAWASETGLTLGQVAVAEQSNELTALPQLLELLDLHEKIVTIDAAGCQKNIAGAIVEQGGDYVLAVKKNQPTLYADIDAALTTAVENESPQLRSSTTVEQGHGREERRTIWVLPAKGRLSSLGEWTGLLTLVLVLRVVKCLRTGVESIETRYYISSLRPSARRLGRAIRGHWNIENGLHWVLDVVFREDGRRLYDRTAAENVALMNRVALSLLRAEDSPSSLKVKRKQAGWNIHYLAQLLGLPSH